MNQEERSERSRSQILRAALKLFSRRGYGATSMRDIALAAKVSTGNVYHQFRGQGNDLQHAARRVPGRR